MSMVTKFYKGSGKEQKGLITHTKGMEVIVMVSNLKTRKMINGSTTQSRVQLQTYL